jgi:hypothetical protein
MKLGVARIKIILLVVFVNLLKKSGIVKLLLRLEGGFIFRESSGSSDYFITRQYFGATKGVWGQFKLPALPFILESGPQLFINLINLRIVMGF